MMNIDLPPETARFIESLVAAGDYPSAGEAVTDGVRLLMSRQQLRVDLQDGIAELNAGQGLESADVFAELRERSKRLTEQAQ